MKGDKYAKTLVKIRVRGIFRIRNRDLYGDAMLVPIRTGTNMADGNQQKNFFTKFCYKSVNLFFEELLNIKVILFLIHELFRDQNSLK